MERSHLAQAAARGDDQALEALVRAHHDRVYRFGRRVCRDPHDAADAVQEAFATLARRREMVRETSVLGWLLTVVRNACMRLLRPFQTARRHLGERLDADTIDPPAPDLDPERALARWRLVHRVHAAIAALEPTQREVLVLRDLEGLSGDEVCAALGLSQAAMKSRLHRAREEIRERVRQERD